MKQFISHRKRDEDVVEKLSEDFSAIYQNEVMERASIGNDDAAHLFRDAPQIREV